MAINPDRNYGQYLTAAVARRSSTVRDIAYNAHPLTKILYDSGRIDTKRAGGPELRIPVNFDKLDAQWFTGYDKIAITPKELLNSAVFNWSRVVSPFSLTGTELLYTSGREEVIDIMAYYIQQAENTAMEAFEEGLMADGTADGGRQMIGLNGAVPIVANTGTYGGIDRATVPNWRTTTYNIPAGDVPGITTWDSTTVREAYEFISLARSRGMKYPDLWLHDALAYRAASGAFVAHQRLVSERLGRLGFSGLTYIAAAGPIDIVAVGGIGTVMPANTVFGLDTKALAIWEFPAQAFVPFHPGNGIRPVNQDAVAQGIVWTGQMVLEEPLQTVRLTTA